jgi:CheY-like chemotaxis protein
MSDRIHQTQKLESLGVLAGGIAHDFNNLLATIMGNADLAERKLDLAHPAGDHVSEVLRASRRAADLCRQILAYAGRGQVSSGVVDLNEVVVEMGELLSVSLPKDARLLIHPGVVCPPVWGDVTQLRQVVLNLLTNAADALPEGRGDIKVTTGSIGAEAIIARDLITEWQPQTKRSLVHLTVEDTGPGMDEAMRARVFEPFFSTKEVGRGLGLAVVLGIVRAHGGALELRSWPGHGSRFRVTLPVTDQEPPPPVIAASWDDHAKELKGTVLLADDEPGVREVCRAMLEEEGLTVIEAVDGQEAVDIFRERRAELHMVLLDITMPRMNGYQALVKIREIDPGARVLLSTGNVQEAEEVETEWGVPLLAKPYGAQELRAAISRVLGGSRIQPDTG